MGTLPERKTRDFSEERAKKMGNGGGHSGIVAAGNIEIPAI